MARKKASAKSKKMPVYTSDMLALQLISGFVIIGLGVLMVLAVVFQPQIDVFIGLRGVCFGLAGSLAALLAVFPVWGGVLMLIGTHHKPPVRPFVISLLIYMLVLTFMNLITRTNDVNGSIRPLLDCFSLSHTYDRSYGTFLHDAYQFCSSTHGGGGWLGMMLAWPLWSVMGPSLSAVVCVPAVAVLALVLFRFNAGKAVASMRTQFAAFQANQEEKRRIQEEQDKLYREQRAAEEARRRAEEEAQRRAEAEARRTTASEDWEQYRNPRDNNANHAPAADAPAADAAPAFDSAQRSTGPVPRRPVGQDTGNYGFRPTDEERKTIRQSLADDTPARKTGSVPPQPPTIENGQPVQPWQSRTASVSKVSRTAEAKPLSSTAAKPAVKPVEAPVQPEKPVKSATAPQPPVKQQPKPSWFDEPDDTPPWEDKPAPVAPGSVQVPVLQAESAAAWTPELNLKPVKSGQLTYGEQLEMEEEEQAALPYIYPGIELLAEPPEQTGISAEEDEMRARRLEETLASFKVQATVRHITHGPAISRFELELAAGINVNRVTNLGANIAMNMEVKSVRIEAPIPGKSLVGIEVPNRKVSTVTLREVLESEAMAKAKSPLVVALGKDIAGTPIVCDLARMPHLLIAGATGSGKSVCINTIINSLLYRCTPEEVRMILVDPKVVELQCYNGIPHLLIPVVSDPHKAAGALAWAVDEMMQRYKRFQEKGVRAIDGYNAHLEDSEERMPRIVIIIDELADLMMTCKRDVEDHICRLAQLARAAGIHLVVATQRPSVDVITGLIKANIPSRIAFKVSSFVDSRTILDKNGAEQLLGWGDMLYQPTGEFTPIRIQGCFLSDNEVNNITDFIREACPGTYDPDVIEQLDNLQREAAGTAPDPAEQEAELTGDGSLLSQAIEMAVRDGQVSTSFIQRRLKIGYARAGRLVDEMEKRGIVGPKDGAKPRMCLISVEDYEEMRRSGQLTD